MEKTTRDNISELVRYLAIGVATTAAVISFNHRLSDYVSQPQKPSQNYLTYHK